MARLLLGSLTAMTEGNAGKGLVQVHGLVLLAIGAEAKHVVFAINFREASHRLPVNRIETAKDAIETENDIRAAKPGFDFLKCCVRGFHEIDSTGNREHDPIVNGAEE
jgi:hypothetical protein